MVAVWVNLRQEKCQHWSTLGVDTWIALVKNKDFICKNGRELGGRDDQSTGAASQCWPVPNVLCHHLSSCFIRQFINHHKSNDYTICSLYSLESPKNRVASIPYCHSFSNVFPPGRPVASICPDADEFGLRILHQTLGPGILDEKIQRCWIRVSRTGRCDDV